LRFAELKTCWLWTCTENAVAWHCYFQTCLMISADFLIAGDKRGDH
jgi:hypothetical protein